MVTNDTTAGSPGWDGSNEESLVGDFLLGRRRGMAAGSVEGRIAAFLIGLGVPDERIKQAVEEGTLDVLTLEAILLPGGRRYSLEAAADMVGVPQEMIKRIRRSLGFPEPRSEEESLLTDEDVEMLSVAKRYLDRDVDPELLVQFVRTLGSSLSRIAEAEIAAVGTTGGGMVGKEIAEKLAEEERGAPIEEVLVNLVRNGVAEIARLLDYGHRRHLVFAARREVAWQAGSRAGVEVGIVGFADMVGFTAMSRQLDPAELAARVEKFGSLAYDLVAAGGGRVVKMIGDEVMFVFEDSASAARVALDLAEACSADKELSPVRVGLAGGDLLVLDGDYYGPVVNLASRVVNIALAGTVIVSEDVFEDLRGSDEFELRPMRLRRLKGIGLVRLWVLGRPGDQRVFTAQDLRQIGSQAVAEILGEGI